MKLTIEINEEEIKELVTREIARRIVEERGYESRELKYGIREGVDKAVKQYIYSCKNEIIDKVVNRVGYELPKEKFEQLSLFEWEWEHGNQGRATM